MDKKLKQYLESIKKINIKFSTEDQIEVQIWKMYFKTWPLMKPFTTPKEFDEAYLKEKPFIKNLIELNTKRKQDAQHTRDKCKPRFFE